MKKLLCALLSVTMLISMTACGSEKEDSKESSESSVTATDETTEEVTEEITIEETVAEEVSEIEGEQSVLEESPAEESSVSGVDGYVYTGETYTYTFNEKWTCSEDLTNFDSTLAYTGGEDEMDAATSIGIQVLPKDGEEVTLSEIAQTMLDTYAAIEEGYVVESHGETTINGYDSYEIVLNVTSMGVTIVMRQIIISNGDNVYVINVTAEESRYEVSVPEIDKVISTFEFID